MTGLLFVLDALRLEREEVEAKRPAEEAEVAAQRLERKRMAKLHPAPKILRPPQYERTPQ